MSTGMIVLVVIGSLFGGCVMCGVAGSKSKVKDASASPSAALPPRAAAAVRVKLPCDDAVEVEVKTWNNALSDVSDHTLVPQSSKLYDTLSELGAGKKVKFSGSFIAGDEKNGFEEASMGERGSMTDPEFIFRFAAVSAEP